jgi:hypothetical protein
MRPISNALRKRLHHRLLADQIIECRGSVFAGKDPVAWVAVGGCLDIGHACPAVLSQMVGANEGGRLERQPEPENSLGLLPSGPDPVGERLVRRQPPAFYIVILTAFVQ